MKSAHPQRLMEKKREKYVPIVCAGRSLTFFLLTFVLLMILNGPVFSGGKGEAEKSPATTSEGSATGDTTVTVNDALGREVSVPKDPDYIICSGAGALRLITYLSAEDKVVAVDDMEGRRARFDARPYALAHPEFKELPLFGEFRGHDNPELIVSLNPLPQLIIKTNPQMGTDPQELEQKTGIPVLPLEYGELSKDRNVFYSTLRTIAEVLDREERAEEVIAFFENSIADLEKRTANIPEEERTSCYVGGIAFRGPHGLQSTEPGYPPFLFTKARNVAGAAPGEPISTAQADVAKEKLVEWDPEVIFIDVSTLQSEPEASALYQLKNDPAYQTLEAAKTGEVYGVLPYNWYTRNFGSILADAYFIGTILYPERFKDIDPVKKADEIWKFLVGKEVFQEMDRSFQGLVFKRIPLK